MKYLIGIDSGGTKSELIAYDLSCNPIYTNIGGYGNQLMMSVFLLE